MSRIREFIGAIGAFMMFLSDSFGGADDEPAHIKDAHLYPRVVEPGPSPLRLDLAIHSPGFLRGALAVRRQEDLAGHAGTLAEGINLKALTRIEAELGLRPIINVAPSRIDAP